MAGSRATGPRLAVDAARCSSSRRSWLSLAVQQLVYPCALVEPRRARVPVAGRRAPGRPARRPRRWPPRPLPALAERRARRRDLLAVHARVAPRAPPRQPARQHRPWPSPPARPSPSPAPGRSSTSSPRDRRVASLAGLLMLASPILAVQGGVYLNYLFTLGLGLLFIVCLRRGRPRAGAPGAWWSPVRLLGWIFLTRPFDAAVWGLLGAVPLVVEHRHRLRALVAPAGVVRASGCCRSWPDPAAEPTAHRAAPPSSRSRWRTPSTSSGSAMRRLMPRFDDLEYGPRLAVDQHRQERLLAPLLPRRRSPRRRRRRRRAPGSAAASASVQLLVALGLAFPIALLRVLRHPHLVAHRPAQRTDLLRARLRAAVRPDRHRLVRRPRSPTTGRRWPSWPLRPRAR